MEAWTAFVTAFVPLFVVVDPLAAAVVFAGLTAHRSRVDVARIARRAALVGAGILVFFALFGDAVFAALGLDIDAVRAAGGALLVLTAIDMLRAKRSDCRCSGAELDAGRGQDDVAVVPVATPLLAGPGAIATVVTTTAQQPGAAPTAGMLLAIAAVFALSFVALRGAVVVQALLGKTGLALLERMMGLVLAAFAVQQLVRGLAGLWA